MEKNVAQWATPIEPASSPLPRRSSSEGGSPPRSSYQGSRPPTQTGRRDNNSPRPRETRPVVSLNTLLDGDPMATTIDFRSQKSKNKLANQNDSRGPSKKIDTAELKRILEEALGSK